MAVRKLARPGAIVAALSLLSGCGLHLAGRQAPLPHRQDAITARLVALGPADPFFDIFVDRPAYAAIFDVHPGAGVRLAYPWSPHRAPGEKVRPGGQSLANSGLSLLSPLRFVFSSTGFPSRRGFGYLVLVACESPIDLERLMPRTLLDPVGWRIHQPDLAGGTLFQVADELARLAAGGQPPEACDWNFVPYVLTPMFEFSSYAHLRRPLPFLASNLPRPEPDMRPAPEDPPPTAPPAPDDPAPPRSPPGEPEIEPPAGETEEEPPAPEERPAPRPETPADPATIRPPEPSPAPTVRNEDPARRVPAVERRAPNAGRPTIGRSAPPPTSPSRAPAMHSGSRASRGGVAPAPRPE